MKLDRRDVRGSRDGRDRSPPTTGDRGIYLKQQLTDKLTEHKQYIDKNGRGSLLAHHEDTADAVSRIKRCRTLDGRFFDADERAFESF